jgi:hypothetical protein
VLCWASYGGLFTGDADARDALVRTTCQGLSPATELTAGMVFEGDVTYANTFDGNDCLAAVDGVCLSSRRTVTVETVALTGIRVELVADEGFFGAAVGTASIAYESRSELRHAPYCTEDRGSDAVGTGTTDLAGSDWSPDSLSLDWQVDTLENTTFKGFGGVDFFGDACAPIPGASQAGSESDDQDATELLFDAAGNVVGLSFISESLSDSVDAEGFGGILSRVQLGTLRRTR